MGSEVVSHNDGSWEAVLFIDKPITLLGLLEEIRWGVSSDQVPHTTFWRLHLVMRKRDPSADINARINFKDGKSVKSTWDVFGRAFNEICHIIAPSADLAYSYDLDVKDYRAHFDLGILPSKTWAYRPAPSHPLELYRCEDINGYLNENWPREMWSARSTLFFSSTENSLCQQELDSSLLGGHFDVANRLLYQSRFNLSVLNNVMASAPLYLYRNAFTPPETDDPWFFIRNDISDIVIDTIVAYLHSINLTVYLCHGFTGLYSWYNAESIPPGAKLAAQDVSI